MVTALLAAGIMTAAPPVAGQPVPAQVSAELTASPGDGTPVPAQSVTFAFPAQLAFDQAGFATCPADVAAQQGAGACPPGAQVGGGAADVRLGPGRAPVTFDLAVFSGAPGHLTVAYDLRGGGNVHEVADASLAGGRLVVPVPGEIQRPEGTLTTEVARFALTLGAAAPPSLATADGCPSAAYAATLQQTDGSQVGTTAVGTCTPPPPDTSVAVELGRVKVVRRSVRIPLQAGEALTVSARLVRGGHTVAKRTQDVVAGARTLRLAVPKRTRPGSARVRIAVRDEAGNRRDVVRRVRIPRR